ncbi:MAG: ATP-binding protein [Bryobacteraceae bacterium]
MADQRDAISRDYGDLPDPSQISVRAQLDRILKSRTFGNAPSLSRFLRHLVQQALAGNANQLKEYSIGVEVFDRGESFDPRIDTIVRVQARRLRAKLEEYYASEGHPDTIIIEVPKGQYVARFRQLSQRDSGAKAPLAVELGFRVRSSEDARPSAAVRQSPLPAIRTPLIGRDKELAILKRMLLADEVRLVTLSGAGGSGKTRLAVQAASELTYQFPGGIWFISLASISDPQMVASTIAQALSLRHAAGKPVPLALREHVHLTIHAPALLVIDNVEHLLESAPLFGELLDASDALKILVTSRSVLRVYGEHEFSVPPLPAPDLNRLPPVSELCQNPAVELFVQRATAVDPNFELNLSNHRAVAEICLRLDGLPLAIELAAARMRMLPPAGILMRLENRLELLTGGARDVHARQQTLRNTIDWSYALLDPFEQKLFRRLAVFAGGCTLESAEAVCDVHRDLGLNVFKGISSLVDKSLLHQREHRNTEPRFSMLESIREYALERLAGSGEDAATRRGHAAYALVIAEERSARSAPGEISDWVELCDAEHDNFRAALDWLIETDHGEWALRLGLALFHFWEAREHLAEGRQRLQRILNMKSTAAVNSARARVAFCAGAFMAAQRDYAGALELFKEALHLYRELGDERGVAAMLSAIGSNRRLAGDFNAGRSWLEQALQTYRTLQDLPGVAGALSNLADVVNAQGDCAAASALLQEALSIFRELGDSAGIAWSFNRLGDVAFERMELAEAHRLYSAGVDIFRSMGDRWGMARSYADLGYVACERRQHEIARLLFVQALETLWNLGHTRSMAKVFEGFACLAIHEENFERALTLAGAAAGLRDTLGAYPRPDEEANLQRKLEAAWKHLDAAQARTIWMSGSRMPLEQAIRYALEQPPPGLTQSVSTGS